VSALGIVAVGVLVWLLWDWIDPLQPRQSRTVSGPMSGRELAGLVGVQYEEELVLVSPRGVELPYCPLWDIDDVLDTLAEVDAL